MVDVLDAHEPDELGVRLVVVERQLGYAAHRRGGVEAVDVDRALRLADRAVGALQNRDVELLLAAEVVVDHALGRAHALGHLVHPRPGIAVRGELAGGHLEDLVARPLGVALAFGGGRLPRWHRARL
jgi:hypothetical protein